MTRDRVTCVQIGKSAIELRHRVVRTDLGTQCLKLGVWELGRALAELTLPFGVLRPFRAAVSAAVADALQKPAMPAGGTATSTDPDDQE